MNKVFIKTYGCQMNVYDSQKIYDNLFDEGYIMTSSLQDADLILLNTCHIREKAKDKLYSDLGRLRIKKIKKTSKIGIIGCTAQAEGEEIITRASIVDFVIGPQSYDKLSIILKKVIKGEKVVDIAYAEEKKTYYLTKKDKMINRGVSAFLTIQEGCNKFCTFCVVPYTRGIDYSRSMLEILNEAKKLAETGVVEIILLGQNVNNWHQVDIDGKKWYLQDLLFNLSKIKGIKRLRYTTSHPKDMNNDLIVAHGSLKELMPQLHLPIQSGSDKILKIMNRNHNVYYYLKLIDKIRNYCPDIAISGDFIVGFPGETEKDFKDTLSLIENVSYAFAYSFKYSPRPGTPGYNMNDQIDEKIKKYRLQELQNLLENQKKQFLKSKIGIVTNVLIEKNGKIDGQMIGKSPWLFPIITNTKQKIGSIVDVIIKKSGTNSLIGLSDN